LKLKERSYKKELLDQDNIPFDDIKQNLKELNTINTLLGGHSITLAGIKKLLPTSDKEIHIVEIGCGGGDNLAYLQKKLKGNLKYTGIDLKESCIDFAKKTYPTINFITNDYRQASFDKKPDIIFTSLFCHHFTDEQLIEQFTWLQANTRIGFIINDLQRHPLAFHSIKILTQLFSKSYLVKNDAPLSVARGFHKDELQRLLSKAKIEQIQILWKWAFRYLVVAKH
jgi:2-polyprenyl-3-methyl-5-hydroxy-6-metoxy-1,4-benzoquinol methylase